MAYDLKMKSLAYEKNSLFNNFNLIFVEKPTFVNIFDTIYVWLVI